jgi:hypothetical protein
MIMFDSNEAAQYKTGLSGWVSKDGFFWGENERAARYQGCTHRSCEDCGQPVEKSYLICKDCRDKKDKAKFDAMPKEVWNEEGGVYSDAIDKYFWSWDEVEEYCGDEGIDEKDLRLVICVPTYGRYLHEDYFEDELPEDGEVPDSIIKAIEDFNKVLKEAGPLSWYPGNKAAIRKV